MKKSTRNYHLILPTHQHEYEHENEGRVEVGHVERRPQPAYERVPAYDDGEEHCCQLRAEAPDEGVEDGGAGDSQGHHHDQVGEEGEAAEDLGNWRHRRNEDSREMVGRKSEVI